jgi:hypothetical protein
VVMPALQIWRLLVQKVINLDETGGEVKIR